MTYLSDPAEYWVQLLILVVVVSAGVYFLRSWQSTKKDVVKD